MKTFIIRVALLAGVLAIILFVIFDRRILIPAGVFLGAFLSLHKIRIYRRLLEVMAEMEKPPSVFRILSASLPVALSFLLLFVAVMVDQWLFMGVAVGLLLAILTILINVVTEKIGLTHNEWVEWF